MMRRVGAVALAVAGCAGAPEDGPPTVHFGQDVCGRCSMIVSDAAFASAVFTDVDGHPGVLPFDDLGCLLAWEADAAQPVSAWWVSSHDGSGWLKAEAAWFVRSPEIRSPMGSGIAALREKAAAEKLAGERGGDVLDWKGLRAAAREGGLVAPPPPGRGT